MVTLWKCFRKFLQVLTVPTLGLCTVSQALAQTGTAKDKQWEAFSPRPQMQLRIKLKPSPPLLTWKLSQAGVNGEQKRNFSTWSGRTAQHIVFIYFISVGSEEVSSVFFFCFSSGREKREKKKRKRKEVTFCWRCCRSALIGAWGLLCQETGRNLSTVTGAFFFLKRRDDPRDPESWNGGHH